MKYKYTDTGDIRLEIDACDGGPGEGHPAVHVTVVEERDRRIACIPAEQRQAAAQALAGDGYRVIPANVPHGCQWTDDPDDPCPVCGQKPPEWERELLAREAEAAQPDRPEPVDPASIKVGDIVDYETTVEYRLCRIMGEVEDVAEHVTGEDGWSLKIHGHWWGCDIATVRILQRPEPVPDEAAVEALYEALRDVYPRAVWDLREAANTLAKRNVRVVSTDE